jgi:hypothetical protein
MEVPNPENQLVTEIKKRALSRSEAINKINQICPQKRALIVYCLMCLDDQNFDAELKSGVLYSKINTALADATRDWSCPGRTVQYDEYCLVNHVVDAFNNMIKKLGAQYYEIEYLSLAIELEKAAYESEQVEALEFFLQHRSCLIKLQ